MKGKRHLLALWLQRFGVLRLLESLRRRPRLLLVNHHRIGDPRSTLCDRGVFSASADELDLQLSFLERHFPIVWGDALEDLVSGRRALTRTHIALTFDDGYRDNFDLAFPVLQSHGVGAAFFLVSGYVGTSTLPWWDEIACLLHTTPAARLRLPGLDPLAVPSDPDLREPLIRTLLRLYKSLPAATADQLLQHLREEAGSPLPAPHRRFLSWDEARAMAAAGMAIGSHTRTHRILARLSPEEQELELTTSRLCLEQQLGRPVTALAYPVGTPDTFTPLTTRLARQAGYRMCFSFFGGVTGGINTPGDLQPHNVQRTGAPADPLLFRTDTLFRTVFGRAF